MNAASERCRHARQHCRRRAGIGPRRAGGCQPGPDLPEARARTARTQKLGPERPEPRQFGPQLRPEQRPFGLPNRRARSASSSSGLNHDRKVSGPLRRSVAVLKGPLGLPRMSSGGRRCTPNPPDRLRQPGPIRSPLGPASKPDAPRLGSSSASCSRVRNIPTLRPP